MNDQPRLDAAVAAWLHTQAPERAPDRLWTVALERARSSPQRTRWRGLATLLRMNGMATAAIGALTLAAVAIMGLALLPLAGSVGEPAGSPRSAPTTDQTPAAGTNEPTLGWPGARAAPAGRYQWDMIGSRWMHHVANWSGPGAVDMTFSVVHTSTPTEGEPVTVAGFPGIREVRPTRPDGTSVEVWTIRMEETTVEIVVEADGDAPEELRAEPIAIIESLERLPRVGTEGYRLVFTLPEGWDSG